MKVDSQELSQLAQAEQAPFTAPRVDLYAGIHKAMRSVMSDTLVALGRMDTEDSADLAATAARLEGLLALCQGHLEHENTFVHPALEGRAQGASLSVAAEHVEHERHIRGLRASMQRLLEAPAVQRPRLAHALYQELALFIAENFHHMHVEETAHNAALWANYTDAELTGIHEALVASIPPEKMMAFVRWLVPAMSPAERAGMLGEMMAHAPAPAFAAVLDLVRPHLSDAEWDKLIRALGLPTF